MRLSGEWLRKCSGTTGRWSHSPKLRTRCSLFLWEQPASPRIAYAKKKRHFPHQPVTKAIPTAPLSLCGQNRSPLPAPQSMLPRNNTPGLRDTINRKIQGDHLIPTTVTSSATPAQRLRFNDHIYALYYPHHSGPKTFADLSVSQPGRFLINPDDDNERIEGPSRHFTSLWGRHIRAQRESRCQDGDSICRCGALTDAGYGA